MQIRVLDSEDMALPLSVYKRLPKRLPYSLGFSRYALSFDGVEQYVEMPDSPSLSALSNLTLEAWIYLYEKPSVLGHACTILSKIETANREWQFTVDTNDRMMFRAWDEVTGVYHGWYGNTVLDKHRWYHVIMQQDRPGVLQRLCLNGIEDGTLSQSLEIRDLSASVQVGCQLWGGVYGSFFYGVIALVRAYNLFLSLAEIRYNMLNYHSPIRDGLVLWHDYEEGTGLKAYDKSGYGNDGDLLPTTNPPKWIRNKMWELRSMVGL